MGFTIPTIWGDPGTQPVRDWVRQNIPGAAAVGNVIGSQQVFSNPITGGGFGPTWKDVSNSVVSPSRASAADSKTPIGPPGPPAGYNPSGGGSNGGTSGGSSDVIMNALNSAGQSQEQAANAEAERRRQAAWGSYNALVGEANSAKEEAKSKYDWIVDTLGSNKQDLLNKAALNETQSLEEYNQTEKKTRAEYDQAKKDTLAGYRDMKNEQEKIMRGMGMQQSSRSMEADLKLNNLMAKDLSTVSSKEADAISTIANAVAAVKQKASDLRDSIERETKSKVDEATLNYQSAINQINNQLNLAGYEREDRINEANSALSSALAGIKTWKANAQVQVGLTMAQLTGNLDNFISWVADDKTGLNSDLTTKKQAVNSLIGQINQTPLNAEASLTNPTTAKYQATVKKTGTPWEETSNDLLTKSLMSPIQTANSSATLGF